MEVHNSTYPHGAAAFWTPLTSLVICKRALFPRTVVFIRDEHQEQVHPRFSGYLYSDPVIRCFRLSDVLVRSTRWSM